MPDPDNINDNSESDLKLIAAAKENPEAFTVLYDKYVTSVYRYFLARVSHPQTAEDLTSQTWLQAFKAFAKYEPRGPLFGSWLFTIAHNILVNNYRKVPTLLIDENFDLEGSQNVESETDRALALHNLKKMLNNLPERDREIVMLRSSEDLSFNQIGEVLNISETAARTAYHRAVQKLVSEAAEGKTYVPRS